MATVKLGDREVVIEKFRGYKAVRVGRLVARLSKHVPAFIDQMADFRRDYSTKHYRRITRAMAEMRAVPDPLTAGEGIDERELVAAQASVDRVAAGYRALLEGELKTKDHIDLPEPPSQGEEIAAVFGDIFQIAEKEVLELLALLVSPNSQLKDAFDRDEVDGYLTKAADDLLFEADLEQLLELAVVGIETVREQFAGSKGAVGKLTSLLSSRAPSTSASPEPAQQETPIPTTPSTPPSPDSSTDSPEPTAGTPSESSSDLAGASSAA